MEGKSLRPAVAQGGDNLVRIWGPKHALPSPLPGPPHHFLVTAGQWQSEEVVSLANLRSILILPW